MLGRAPESYRESFELLAQAGALSGEALEKIKPSVGLRNTIVHEYITIDFTIVAAAVPLALETYTEYQHQVASFVYERTQRG